MEDDLFDWVVKLRGRHLRVSRQMIRTQAKALSGNEEFKASRGWLDRFMKRHSSPFDVKQMSAKLYHVTAYQNF